MHNNVISLTTGEIINPPATTDADTSRHLSGCLLGLAQGVTILMAVEQNKRRHKLLRDLRQALMAVHDNEACELFTHDEDQMEACRAN